MTRDPPENLNNFSLKIYYFKKVNTFSILVTLAVQSGNIILSTNEVGNYYQSSSSIKKRRSIYNLYCLNLFKTLKLYKTFHLEYYQILTKLYA